MRAFHIIACLALIAMLIWLNRAYTPGDALAYGGLTWLGWASIVAGLVAVGFFALVSDWTRALRFFRNRSKTIAPPTHVRTLDSKELAELKLDKYRGPSYPHPVIFPERCIGCQACVDACPHDVLAIVDGTAAAVAPDLCMEDTACQAECPVNPKACIVINTTKDVRSLPTPTRDGASYETNVAGCYIIGDVSGVPLIKNAVKEGADVITHIAKELAGAAAPDAGAEYDVAIIGIGPGGASAAATAKDAGLRYIALEQNNTLSTIDLYPKGKYIFFKPDTKDWFGGIPAAGLGLAKAKYGDEADDHAPIYDALDDELNMVVAEQTPLLHAELIDAVPQQLQNELSQALFGKIGKELRKRIAAFLRTKGGGDWGTLYRTHFLAHRDDLLAQFRADIVDQLQTKIPGDSRENILSVWLASLAAKGVKINEFESCRSVKRDESSDCFTVTTESGNEKTPHTYTARRVVIAIGLRGAPNKLRLANEEDLKVVIDGREQQKVIYALSNPMEFRGKDIIVVGGGNVAVEAAVDLIAVRDGANITARKPEDMNRVTILVRDYLAPTVKFGNKLQLYNSAEDGLLDLKFGVGIREMRATEVVIENVKTKEVVATIPNDFVFALIGGERPNRFLESIGITIK